MFVIHFKDFWFLRYHCSNSLNVPSDSKILRKKILYVVEENVTQLNLICVIVQRQMLWFWCPTSCVTYNTRFDVVKEITQKETQLKSNSWLITNVILFFTHKLWEWFLNVKTFKGLWASALHSAPTKRCSYAFRFRMLMK